MKKITIAILLMSALFGGTKKTVYGMEELSDQIFESLEGYGRLTFQDLKVIGKLDAAGQIALRFSKIGTLRLKGEGTISHVEVKKKAELFGLFQIENSSFDQLFLSGDHLLLDGCTIRALHVKEGEKSEKIEIRGKSTIGKIVFASGKGEVLLGAEATVSGKIEGGVIKKL